ncbi:MAG: thioredoxin family protein [Bacteroidaceae bacterium]|nr:thioredoxin family protein [Bacteroidaceae bacterium]
MKKLFITMIALCVSACMQMMAQGVAFEPEGTTLEEASKKAKAENKLIFLDCYTQWCGPCKKMTREVFPQEAVGNAMNPKFVSIKIDMESAYGAPLAKKLQIQAYPTFVIFNADAQEIGRFIGGSPVGEFLNKVEANSKDNSTSALVERWNNGDRDPQFLREYLKSLSAKYKADEANLVAEAILDGKETTFIADAELRGIFLSNITNPFSKSFKYVLTHQDEFRAVAGDRLTDGKIASVLSNYQRLLINEKEDGTVTLDEAKFNDFKSLLSDAKVANADHYTLSTLITLAEKQKDYDSFIKYINQYLKNKSLDADDMQLANWAKPFADPSAPAKQKAQMKKILQKRVDEIESGKRQAKTQLGNMRLSRSTGELLKAIIDAFDGKMPQK